MLENTDLLSMLVFVGVFVVTCALGLFALLKIDKDQRVGVARLRDLAAPVERERPGLQSALRSWLPRVGSLLLPADEQARAQLQLRLSRAGLYRPGDVRLFLGLKLLLGGGLLLAVLIVYLLGVLSVKQAILGVVLALCAGVGVPGLWVDGRTRRRQAEMRRALPDALDMLVLCAEGGISMAGAVQRVASELQVVHPLLGAELHIIQREMQMGLSAGDAMKKFADRCGLDEIRDLASVLLQSERYGAGVVKALRIYADTARQERQQRAEEMAQKATVKILFPMLLCIFPTIFIVILGPAAYQIAGMLSRMK
jgi:tight adherence protein C